MSPRRALRPRPNGPADPGPPKGKPPKPPQAPGPKSRWRWRRRPPPRPPRPLVYMEWDNILISYRELSKYSHDISFISKRQAPVPHDVQARRTPSVSEVAHAGGHHRHTR